MGTLYFLTYSLRSESLQDIRGLNFNKPERESISIRDKSDLFADWSILSPVTQTFESSKALKRGSIFNFAERIKVGYICIFDYFLEDDRCPKGESTQVPEGEEQSLARETTKTIPDEDDIALLRQDIIRLQQRGFAVSAPTVVQQNVIERIIERVVGGASVGYVDDQLNILENELKKEIDEKLDKDISDGIIDGENKMEIGDDENNYNEVVVDSNNMEIEE